MKKNIFEIIDEIKAEREAKLSELKAKREAYEKEQQQKESKAAEILKNGTPEQYAKAKAAAAESAYTLEFYQKRIDELENAPVYEDPDKLLLDIKEYVDKLTKESLKQEDAVLAEIRDKAEARRLLIVKANQYAQEIEHRDIFAMELMKAGSRVRVLNIELGEPVIVKGI